VYPSFLFCPLLGITFTCAPALLSKRTLTKRVEEDDSTNKKRNIYLLLLAILANGFQERLPDYIIISASKKKFSFEVWQRCFFE